MPGSTCRSGFDARGTCRWWLEKMCTLIVIREMARGHELVVAANRDEHFARPASPPALQASALGWIAPLDRQGGGTWIGVNRRGVFVGLVNLRESPAVEQPRRSRGLLVRDALERSCAAQIADEIERLLAEPCNSFQLVYGDGFDLFLTVHGASGTRTMPLDRGLHVVCNRVSSAPHPGKARRIRAELAALDWETEPAHWRAALVELLGRHPDGEQPSENTCVHSDGYGTRSSEILARGASGWRWWHAEGPPCRTSFVEISHLWQRLQRFEKHGSEEGATMTEEARS
jgi:uncharacterized protein with NRDE domain